ncbi:MAG: EamA family transporter, partial [Woeseiaceae bacterium]
QSAIVCVFPGHEFSFDATFTYIASLVSLAVFGSVIAFGEYLTLLGRIGAHRAGYATVMFPVVALTLSILLEGLRLDLSIVHGTMLLLLGNELVLKEQR